MVYASRYLRITSPPMKGPDIELLQRILNEKGLLAAEADGTFDEATAKAVKGFQELEGLPADEVVGPDAWRRLLTSCCLAKPNRSSAPSGILITVDLSKRRLTFSAPGMESRSYPVAIGKPSTPTPVGNWTIVQKAMHPGGPFGARWMRLSIPWGGYGIHGTNNPKSIGKAVSHGCVRLYNEDVIELYDLTPLGTPVAIIGSAYTGRVLQRGDRGSEVRFVQNVLRELEYYFYKADGFYGPRTQTSVKVFQADQGITVDGVVGAKTWNALQKAQDMHRGNVHP